MRKTYYIITLAFLFITAFNIPQPTNQETPMGSDTLLIDTVIIKKFGLTMDCDSAEIKYNIQVTSWDQPIKWSMEITSQENRILFYSSLDSTIDAFFADTDYLSNCSDYTDCKQKWYLDRITYFYIDTIKIDDERRVYFHTESNEIFEQYFRDFSISVNEPDKLLDKYWAIYSKKDIIGFTFFFTPMEYITPLLAYYPEEKMFLPIYHP